MKSIRRWAKIFKYFLLWQCSVTLAWASPGNIVENAPVVQTQAGQVQGVQSQGVWLFKGIPFAASVAGEQRWLPPQPAAAWSGVLDATQDAPTCAQAARYRLTERSDHEDCLRLNIATPAAVSAAQLAAQNRPVLVWLHGGAFVGGAASLYRIDSLARKLDAVVVTVNYRLGVFGFMAHPSFEADSNGGYALLDQRLALRWVQDNIRAFGGDPGNITVAGESAGGASVCMHLMTPEHTTGLFHKAIITSAACSFALKDQSQGQAFGQEVAKQVGCEDPATALACLRQVPVATLIAAGDRVAADDLTAFAPVYGSSVLPRQGMASLEAGQFHKIPVIFGGTRDELRLYVGYAVQAGDQVTADNYLDHLRAVYGAHAEKVAVQYPLPSGASAAEMLGTVNTHFYPAAGLNHCQYVDTVKLLARQLPVYMMEFADRDVPVLGVSMPATPDPGFSLGAVHSSDLNYFFPNFSNTSRIDAPDLSPASQTRADQVIAYWRSFMRTGVPAGEDLPQWLPFNVNQQSLRVEPVGITTFDPDAQANCNFWRGMYAESFSVLTQ